MKLWTTEQLNKKIEDIRVGIGPSSVHSKLSLVDLVVYINVLERTIQFQRAYLGVSPYNQTDLMVRGAIEVLSGAHEYIETQPWGDDTNGQSLCDALKIITERFSELRKELKEFTE